MPVPLSPLIVLHKMHVASCKRVTRTHAKAAFRVVAQIRVPQ